MSWTRSGVLQAATIMLLPLMPLAVAEDAVSARYDCLFQPWTGGQLVAGAIIAPETFAHAPVAARFVIEDAATGTATVEFGDHAVPAWLEILEPVLHFGYEFPGLSAGFVTISRTWENGGFPAVRSDQGWYDGVLSVGYSSGLCQAAG